MQNDTWEIRVHILWDVLHSLWNIFLYSENSAWLWNNTYIKKTEFEYGWNIKYLKSENLVDHKPILIKSHDAIWRK